MNATDIVCTVGPMSSRSYILREMRLAGMTSVRVNMAHAPARDLLYFASRVRAITPRIKVLADLPGPKIRIGDIQPRKIAPGMQVSFTTEQHPHLGRIPVGFAGFPSCVSPGEVLHTDDGRTALEVKEVQGNEVHCEVLFGEWLLPRKGINCPGEEDFDPITAEDEALIPQLKAAEPQYVAASFVQSAEGVLAVRRALDGAGMPADVLAKIETPHGVEHIREIVECDATAGVIVARGDLAYEAERAELLHNALRVILEAKRAGKLVIMATQMLDSMVRERVPTRAEIFDVSLAVALGCDGVMTSNETAEGSNPEETAKVIREIVSSAQ